MPIKDFESARVYLESLIPKEREDYERIGLARMRSLLEAIGNPQDSYPTIHVGGTAGKGSTATMIASILQSAGYRTGLHVSPHLQDVRERMQVNGRFIGEKEFVGLVLKIKKGVEQAEKGGYGRPSYFEALLALSFECFRMEKVEIAVVEVGMGGRLDGTNVINPKVVVLTNIGLDHMEFLGDSIEKIALEKVGIFKEGIDVVTGVTQPSVLKIVDEAAAKLGCRVEHLGKEIKAARVRQSEGGFSFDLAIDGKKHEGIALSLMGLHQVGNAALAIGAALRMNQHGFSVDDSHVRRALEKIILPCRFEIVSRNPTVILDGAHNPMKVKSLVDALASNYKGRRISFVFAVKKDKNVKEMVDLLSPIASKFYFTGFLANTDVGRWMCYDPKELAKFTDTDSEVLPDSHQAYRKAVKEAGKDGIVCVTGSLYLAGELRS
jgi:dihydrofolate synthase / folylpolyglutamate synthase